MCVRKMADDGIAINLIIQLQLIYEQKRAIAPMHGPHSIFDTSHCTVIHRDGRGVSLVDPKKGEKN